MSAKVTPAAPAARPSAPPAVQPRADRTARPQETAPLNVPITAAFIGLLLMRDAGWVEDTAATASTSAGAPGVDLPPGGGEVAAARARPALGDGAELALDGGERGAAAPAAAASTVARFVQRGEAAAARADGDVFQLGGAGRPIDVTLEGLQINGMPMALGAGGRPPAQAELASEEATHFDGAGYLAQIEDVQLGGDGDDTLTGTDGNDYISGNDGDDTISGNDGDDTLHGDAGDDTVDGGAGHDNVYGDAGDDDLDGGDGSDVVHGGTGDDTLQGGDAADWGFDNLYGGFGGDSYTVNHLSDVPDESWVVDAGVDTFRVTGAFIDDFTGAKPYFTAADSFGRLPGEVAAGDHVHVSTGIENVVLEGAWDADVYGGGGDNLLVGNAGANTIKGFAGADVLDGRGGENRLEGGRGADTYLVETTLDGVATIVDGDGPGATTANTLRFKGVERADLAIARDGDAVTFHLDGVLRARIEGYDAQGPVFHVATDEARFDLLGINHAPRQGAELVDEWVVEEGGVGQYGLPEDIFVDVDVGDAVTMDARLADGAALPSWLSFDAEAGRFVAVPPEDVVTGDDTARDYIVEVTATDESGATASDGFRFRVTGEPSADDEDATPDEEFGFAYTPKIATGLEGAVYQWQLREGTFNGGTPDRVDAWLDDLQPLPDWIRFDESTWTLSARAPEPVLGDGHETRVEDGVEVAVYDLRIQATRGETTAFANAELKIATENDPIAATRETLGSWEVDQGNAFSIGFAVDELFEDPDTPQERWQIEVTEKPDWLKNVGEFAFDGTPAQADVGDHKITIRAHDGVDDAPPVEQSGNIEVIDVNDPPFFDGEALQTANDGYEHIDEVMPKAGPSHVVRFNISDYFSDPDQGDDLTVKVARGDTSHHELDWVDVVQEGDEARIELRPGLQQAEAFEHSEAKLEVWVEDREDGGLASNSTTLKYRVDPLPELVNEVPFQQTKEDQNFEVALSGRFMSEGDQAWVEPVADATLPAWLEPKDEFTTFSGTPGNEDVGSYTIKLKADDAGDHPQIVEFTIEVQNTNDAPFAIDPLDDVSFEEGEPVRIELPPTETLFDDVDLIHDTHVYDEKLTLSAPDKPWWLNFDASERAFNAQAANVPDVTADTDYTVTLRATDQAGATAELAFDLTVEAVNHAPEIAKEIDQAPVAIEGQHYEWRDAREIFDDEDQDDASLELTARSADNSSLPGWLDFDEKNATFSGTPGDADPGTYEVHITATDKADASVDTVLTFEVKNVNDAPVVGTPVDDLSVAEGAAVAITVPEDLFTDADLPFGDDLDVFAPGLPSWLAFDAPTGELTGTARNVEADSGYTVTLRATDNAGKTVETSFAIDVAGTNEAPQVTDDPTPQGAAEDAPFSWALPAGLFSDPEGGPVTLSAGLADGSSLPAWLGFHAATRTFTGVPGDADIGSLQLRVTAADRLGATTSVDATLDVANVNDTPEVTATIVGRTATVGEAMAPLTVTGFFADADLPFGDTLTFTAGGADGSHLPEGLVFDGTTLSGTATAAGQHMLRITATDEAGESISQDFRLTVEPPAGATDPLELAADGTVPMSVLGGEPHAAVTAIYSSGSYYYAEGEPYSQVPEIDSLRYFIKDSYQQDHIVVGGDKTAAVLGNDADNIILGNDGANVIVGQGGDDTLYGAGGYDALYGGAGDDMLVSGTGSNDLHGGAGDDRYEIGGHGEAGLREGDLDTISDDAGANIVDFDGVTSGQMRFDMDGADLVVAVEGGGEVRIDDVEAGDATFEVQADDRSWDHAALLAAVEEVRAQTAAIAAEPASFKSDVLEGFLGDDAAPPANPDPIAAFVPDPGEVDAAPTDGRGGALAPADEPSGTFLAPDEGATTTTAAAAGLAPKTALEEDPAYA